MRLTVEQHIVLDAVDGDFLLTHIQLTTRISVDLEDGLCRESKSFFERCSTLQPDAPLPIHAPPLGLTVECQLHLGGFLGSNIKGKGILADCHPEEIWIIGVLQLLIPHRRQKPRFDCCGLGWQAVEEKGFVFD